MTRRAAKVDSTQGPIVKALRQVGATVQSIARVGDDCPDLLVGFRQVNYVFEVKTDKGKLSPGQEKWLATWQGPCAVIRSIDDVFKILGISTINP